MDETTIERLRDRVRGLRDLQLEVDDLEQSLKAKKEELFEMQHKTLPDLFMQIGVDKIGLPAEGNLPAYDAKVEDYYKASIAASWPPERQAAAFSFLEERGDGDLIKTVFLVSVGRGDRPQAKKLEAVLKKAGFEFTTSLSVPWNTLTAWLKEEFKSGRPLTVGELETVGGMAGQVLRLKERK